MYCTDIEPRERRRDELLGLVCDDVRGELENEERVWMLGDIGLGDGKLDVDDMDRPTLVEAER